GDDLLDGEAVAGVDPQDGVDGVGVAADLLGFGADGGFGLLEEAGVEVLAGGDGGGPGGGGGGGGGGRRRGRGGPGGWWGGGVGGGAGWGAAAGGSWGWSRTCRCVRPGRRCSTCRGCPGTRRGACRVP